MHIQSDQDRQFEREDDEVGGRIEVNDRRVAMLAPECCRRHAENQTIKCISELGMAFIGYLAKAGGV